MAGVVSADTGVAGVTGRWPLDDLRLAAAAGAAGLIVSSSGDVVLLVALLGLAATDAVPALVAGLSLLAIAIRWGTASITALAGAQAVLGPAVLVGPIAAAAGSVSAALALVLVAPGRLAAPVFGAAAGAAVAGPGGSTATDLATRGASMLLGAVMASAVDSFAPRRVLRPMALLMAAAAVVLAVVA
jgi:hypothetical protein